MTIKRTVRAFVKSTTQIVASVLPFLTRRNVSIALGIASLFGIIAPDAATDIRNVILAPIGVESEAGDLL